ncbi:MAG: DUF4270 family protein [Bacteroidales bacterium]
MKSILYVLFGVICVLTAISSCGDNPTGDSISQTTVEVIKDSTFMVTASSVEAINIPSRTTLQVLGEISAENFGIFKSDFVTQFMPSQNLDTASVTADQIDSLVLSFRLPKEDYFVGDSLIPMRLDVYRLNKQLETPIYSDFDPTDYYSESDLLGSEVYSLTNLMKSDSIDFLTYYEINVHMPLELGVEIFNEYLENPSTFYNPTNFAEFFPGVYVTTSYGNGRVINIGNTEMTMFYRQIGYGDCSDGGDSTYYESTTYLAVTPEIITNNIIDLSVSESIINGIENDGDVIIQAPTGYNAYVKFPTQEVVDRYYEHKNGDNLVIINNLYFEIPVTEIASGDGIAPPTYLLLVREDDLDEYLLSSEAPDNVNSFYAMYDDAYDMYSFTDMRDFLIDILPEEGVAVDERDCNMVLVPVNLTIETDDYGSSVITNVAPYVAIPAIAKLNMDEAMVRLICSKREIQEW